MNGVQVAGLSAFAPLREAPPEVDYTYILKYYTRMSKEKLTLYMDQKTSRLAHEVSESLGKSISELVRQFTVDMYQKLQGSGVSPEISKWIGVLKTRKSYQSLRDESVKDRLKRYEGLD